jgi:hypothetical protein
VLARRSAGNFGPANYVFCELEGFMFKQIVAMTLASVAAASVASGQTRKPAGTKSVTDEITVTTPEGAYSGTLTTAIEKGQVTGDIHITVPTEITGKVAGTAKGGVMMLEFPYLMVERNCEGTVRMNIKLPAKRGPATGTMEAFGCGRDESQKLTGTVELKPAGAKTAK